MTYMVIWRAVSLLVAMLHRVIARSSLSRVSGAGWCGVPQVTCLSCRVVPARDWLFKIVWNDFEQS